MLVTQSEYIFLVGQHGYLWQFSVSTYFVLENAAACVTNMAHFFNIKNCDCYG